MVSIGTLVTVADALGGPASDLIRSKQSHDGHPVIVSRTRRRWEKTGAAFWDLLEVSELLQSLEYCIKNLTSDAFVTEVLVATNHEPGADNDVVDPTDRSSAGCYPVEVGHTGRHCWGLRIDKAGDGQVTVYAVQSVWRPVAEIVPAATD